MNMHSKFLLFLSGCFLFLWSASYLAADIAVRFPTSNTALLNDRPQDFYMYVDRNFEGQKSQPWQAGAYGFTRTLVRTQAGPVATKFHEGIDIKPLKRDAAGVPLDDVHPVAGGIVVHASANPAHSNYGRYVVIEHWLKDGRPPRLRQLPGGGPGRHRKRHRTPGLFRRRAEQNTGPPASGALSQAPGQLSTLV